MLLDLQELGKEVQSKYRNEFNSNEIVLSDEFKKAYEEYLHTNKQDITFSMYTVTVTSSKNKKMYIPNQWFLAAGYMIDYIIELKKYKNIVFETLGDHFDKVKLCNSYVKKLQNSKSNDVDENNSLDEEDENTLLDDDIEVNDIQDNDESNVQEDNSEINQQNETIEQFRGWVEEYLIKINAEYSQMDIDFIIRFVTDYSWWNGKKTIDRGDFYVTPVLNLLEVVHVSQAFIADIAYVLASEGALTQIVKDGKVCSLEEENLELPPTELPNTNIRKTGGVNLIVYGAPGTGKSTFLKNEYEKKTITERVVFHSEYSYFDFIGSYKPAPVYKNTSNTFTTIDGRALNIGEPYVDYKFVPGPFIKVLVDAWCNQDKMYTLLIEEINRADAAAVFGEVFQLLDRDLNGMSEYSYMPSDELQSYLLSIQGMDQYIKDGVRIPSNLNIVATMNSADQGVKPMDTAFKRRWNYKYMKINIKDAIHEKARMYYAGREIYWGSLVEALNKKLLGSGLQIEEDKLIGPYYIKPAEVGKRQATDKLLLYLWDDVLRHCRDVFFNKEIHSFAELSEKFETEDVFDFLVGTEYENFFALESDSVESAEDETEDENQNELNVTDTSDVHVIDENK